MMPEQNIVALYRAAMSGAAGAFVAAIRANAQHYNDLKQGGDRELKSKDGLWKFSPRYAWSLRFKAAPNLFLYVADCTRSQMAAWSIGENIGAGLTNMREPENVIPDISTMQAWWFLTQGAMWRYLRSHCTTIPRDVRVVLRPKE